MTLSPHHILNPSTSRGPVPSSPYTLQYSSNTLQYIQLRLRAQDETETIIQMKRKTMMEKLRRRYGAKIGVPPASLRFLFDGQRIGNTDTPDILQMEHDDVIEVYFEEIGRNHFEQIGGNHFEQIGGNHLEQIGGNHFKQIGGNHFDQFADHDLMQIGGHDLMQISGE